MNPQTFYNVTKNTSILVFMSFQVCVCVDKTRLFTLFEYLYMYVCGNNAYISCITLRFVRISHEMTLASVQWIKAVSP